MKSGLMRRLACLIGAALLSAAFSHVGQAANVTITDLGFPDSNPAEAPVIHGACTTTNLNGTCLNFTDTIQLVIAAPIKVIISVTKTSGSFTKFDWEFAGPGPLDITGSGFGDPIPTLTGLLLTVPGTYTYTVKGSLAYTVVSAGRYHTDGGAYLYSVEGVPIPAAALLFGSGLALIGFARRYSRRTG